MSEDISHLDFDPEDPELREGLNSMGGTEHAENPAEPQEAEEASVYDVYDGPPRSHREIAESLGDDMSDIDERALQAQIEVFGQDELDSVEGHEATEESTEALTNAIKALTQEKASGQEEFRFQKHGERIVRKLQRRLSARDAEGRLKQQLWLDYYPDGASGASPNISGSAAVDICMLHSGERNVPGYGKARTRDDMYVDKETGRPMLVRSIDTSRWNSPNSGIAAEREATEDEVQETMDLVTKLVQEESQRQAARAA